MLSKFNKRWIDVDYLYQGFLLMILSMTSSHVFAYQWYWQPEVSFTQGYDENPAYRTDNILSSQSNRTDFLLRTGLNAETHEFDVQYRWRDIQYDRFILSGQQDNRTEQRNNYLTFNGQYALPRFLWSFEARNTDEQSFEIAFEDTGEARGDLIKNEQSISTNFRHLLSERVSLQFAISYSETNYNLVNNSLVDNRFQIYSLNYQYQLTPRLAITNGISRQEFSTIDILNQSDTDSLMLGVNWQFSSTLQGDITTGYRKTSSLFENRNPVPGFPGVIVGSTIRPPSKAGQFININLTKGLSISSLDLSLNNSLIPNATGSLDERNELTFSLNTRFNYRFRVSLRFRYFDRNRLQISPPNENGSDNQQNNSLNNDNRIFRRLTTSFNYRLDRYWTFVTAFHIGKQYFSDETDARSRTLSIGFIYRGKEQRSSY